MSTPITSIYTALIIGVAICIIYWVVKVRQANKVWLGEGGNEHVTRCMRAQANLVETAPFLLIAMLLMEFNGMAGWFLHLFGIVLVLARIAHPIGMSNRYPDLPFRFGGTVATFTLLIIAAITLLGQALFA